MTVFVTGATGLVGRRLVTELASRGDGVLSLSRRAAEGTVVGVETLQGDPCLPGRWLGRMDDCDAVVHLAGENIFAKRWSKPFMAQIRLSRVVSTTVIAERLAANPLRADGTPKVFISASAVGYYGTGDDERDESSPAGTDFMAEVSVAWEAAADAARRAGVRVVHPRFGIVLDSEGGALPNLMTPFRFFVGGPVGSGKQWVSWVHRDEVTAALLFLIDNPIHGPVNVTAPNPVTNREFSETLGQVLRRPSWLPMPRFATRILLGKVADVATAGQMVMPRKLTDKGFEFQWPKLSEALTSLLQT